MIFHSYVSHYQRVPAAVYQVGWTAFTNWALAAKARQPASASAVGPWLEAWEKWSPLVKKPSFVSSNMDGNRTIEINWLVVEPYPSEKYELVTWDADIFHTFQ